MLLELVTKPHTHIHIYQGCVQHVIGGCHCCGKVRDSTKCMQSNTTLYLILHPQTLFYLFYQTILQLTLHPNFYFYIQPNKII